MLNIKKVITGELEENCYIIENNSGSLIVDPGADYNKIKEEIKKPLLGILITHRHPDHIGALEELLNNYKCQIFEYISTTEDTYKLGDFNFNVINTPGHTKDSICFYFYEEKILFSGDFLFAGSIGRTDLGGNDDDMKRSLKKIKKYPLEMEIYPGHGDKTTLEKELAYNPFL
jgi:glyoxylase-like metal-dependent hydrolase (beta-lactamase superfamily II)